PRHTSFSDGFEGPLIDTGPFEPDELAAEHHNRPSHSDVRLRDQGPPVKLAALLLLDAVIGSVLAVIDEIVSIFAGKQVAAPLPERFAVRRPSRFVLR